MLGTIIPRARSLASGALSADMRWRYDLFALRKLIDRRIAGRPGARHVTERLVDRLLDALRTEPTASVAVIRQLQRIGERPRALAVIDEIWESRAQSSAEWALACAKAWYDNEQVWRGDIALSHGFSLDPDSSALIEEQANNRRWRGQNAPAIEAATRMVERSANAEEARKWHDLIGELCYAAEDYGAAAEHLGAGGASPDDWRYWYRLASSRERFAGGTGSDAAYAEAATRAGLTGPSELHPAELHYLSGDMQGVIDDLEGRTVSGAAVIRERISLLARALVRLERLDEARRILVSDAACDVDPALLALRGLVDELAGDPGAAMGHYERALMPHSAAAPLETGERAAVLRRSARAAGAAGRPKLAVAAWLDALTHESSLKRLDDEVDPSYAWLVSMARQAIRRGELSRASRFLERLASASSSWRNQLRVCWNLARVRDALGDDDGAWEALRWSSGWLLPHADETEPGFKHPGPLEMYIEAAQELPIAENVVLYESFHGSKVACNPYALCLELVRQAPELQHVWAVQEGAHIPPELVEHPSVSFVRINSQGYRRHLATAKYLINNTSFPRYFIRRRGQRYLNTWHGVPWKKLGRDVSGDPFAFDNIARNFLQATHIALSDEHTKSVLLRSQDVKDLVTASVVISGQPRVDRTVNLSEELRRSIRARMGVKPGERLVAYLPTWRGAVDMVEEAVGPFLAAVRAMAEADRVRVAVRVHHFISSALRARGAPENVIIVPDDIDTNDLLGATDLLVSDYSSVLFDYAPLQRPIVKYLYDWEEYSEERGLYFPSADVPGRDCLRETDLSRVVQEELERSGSVDWTSCATAPYWSRDDGGASARVIASFLDDRAEVVEEQFMDGIIALATASLNPNGITRSLRNLIGAVPELAERSRIVIPRGALANLANRDVADELHERSSFTLTTQRVVATRRENQAWRQLRTSRSQLSPGHVEVLRSRMQRERRRTFGSVTFSAAIDFDGYGLYQTALTGLGFPEQTRSVYVLHMEFEGERRLKYPYLRATAKLLDQFDVLASVSESAMIANRDGLSRAFGVPPEKHAAMPNTIDIGAIRDQAEEPLETDLETWFSRPGAHVVVAGRLSPEKNQGALLDAMALLTAEELAGLRVCFLGDGPRMAELVRQASRLGLSDRVLFAGHRNNPYPAIRRADALFVTSLHEGQALVLMEAMTLGTPVVSTDITGPSSVLDGGRLGVLVPPTPVGLKAGLLRARAGDLLSPDEFDPDAYQRDAARAFAEVVRLDSGALSGPEPECSPARDRSASRRR